jgi:general secretion pathway protein G
MRNIRDWLSHRGGGACSPSTGRVTRVTRVARAVQRGFTLLEIMIVLAIMGMIVTGVSIKVFSQLKKAKVQAARMGVKKIVDASGRFMSGPGSGCPKGIDELITQGELSKGDSKDPWGAAYVFRCPGTQDTDGVDVASWGPDRADGTTDDIRSWEIQ